MRGLEVQAGTWRVSGQPLQQREHIQGPDRLGGS
jgi:hypothetical protein